MKKIPDPAGFNHKAHENADHWLADLRDINLSTAPTDGQALTYDTDTGLWLPATISTGQGGDFSWGGYTPSDYGWLSWSHDPAGVGSWAGYTFPTSGETHFQGVRIEAAGTVANIVFRCAVADASANTAKIGVWNSSGTRLGVTANFASSLTTTGFKEIAFSSSFAVTAGQLVWIGCWSPAADPTSAQIDGRSITGSLVNATLAAGSIRFGVDDAATTDIPGDITPSTDINASTATVDYWFCLKT